ncbi:MAG: immunoglobulin domain-containing protein [Planctomycetes bacterium]|nr:immunoglobulin domain-containing protein [Planctomycetota bacterium]
MLESLPPRHRVSQLLITLLALSLALLPLGVAHAQTLTWTGAANGTTFSLAGNWSPAVSPGATHDCIIPAGPSTISVGNANVRSITTARNLLFEGCDTVTLTGGIALQSGAVVQIDNTGGCTGLIFSGGSQSISGSGSIFISSEGNGGNAISVQSGCTLSIDPSISITYGAGATGSLAQIRLESGTTLNNSGTIAVAQTGRTFNISGPGTFHNSGTLRAGAGTLGIIPDAWSSTGQFLVETGAVLKTAGAFTSLGTITNSGGTVIVSGAATGATLTASTLSGPITLQNAVLTNCVLESPDGTGFTIDGTCALSGCTIGTNVTGACVFITIRNGLVFANGAVLSAGGRCDSARITISGGAQLISGSGQIRLHSSGSNSGNGALVIAQSASVTFGPGITIVAPASDPWTNLQILPGSSLVNNGTISVGAREFNIDVRDASAHFINNGTIELLSGSTASVLNSAWTNAGTISVTGAKLTLDSSWINDGSISASSASTLKFNGSQGTNNGAIAVTNSNASFWSTTWTNASQITATSSTLELRGIWNNPGLITNTNTAVMLAGTFSSLGNFARSGGTMTLAQGIYTGPALVATPATGDLILDSVSMSGTTLTTQGASFIVTGPTMENCTIACDLLIGIDRQIRVKGNLTLANNAVISLGTSAPFAYADGFSFTGGTQAITGAGTIFIANCPSLFTFNSTTTLTLGPGIKLVLGPNAGANALAQIPIPSGSTLINQGTISVAQAGCELQIYQSGTFKNEGILDVVAGTLDIDNLSGLVGIALVASGAKLELKGSFTIDQPIDCHGALTLEGTWTNNSTVTVTNGSLTLLGTWTNAGTFALNSSPWTVSGTFSGLGHFTAVSSPQTYLGTIPSGLLITADASTGDIILDRASFTNSTLRAEGGAVFRIASGSGQFLNLNGCTLAGNLLAGNCGNITLTNGLTLANSAELSLESGESCGPAVLVVATGSQTIGGIGQISFRNLSFTTGSIQVQNNASLTIASGVSLICPNNSRSGGRITTSSLASLTNFGLISMRMPATSFVVGGTGTFNNSGTVESIAGDLVVNPTTLQNFDTTTLTLSGGKWISRGGSLTLGTRIIRNIGPGAVIDITGSSAAIPTLTSLRTIDGTLRLAARNITTAPANGTLYNSGLIDLAPDGVLTINGGITLNPSGTVRIEIKGASTGQFGRIKPSAAASVAGHLRGAFIAPYSPAPGTIFSPVVYGSPITGAFSDICFDDNPQHMSVTQNLVPFQLQLIPSTSSGFAPVITLQPDNAHASPDATFSVLAAPADATYQWRKGGTPLTDGPTPSGSTISGSQTASLTIHNAHPEDAGSYDALISNTCGSATSDPATLSVCTGDLNADGLVDDADFVLFLAGYNILDCADPTMPANCPADLNNDGVVDDADFVIFVPAYDALVCP